MQIGYKKCSVCNTVKEFSKFTKRSDTKNSYRSACKCCTARKLAKKWAESKDYREKGKGRSRKHSLQKNYGLTISDFNKMSKDRDHKCDICGTHVTNTSNDNLHVDHDHITGVIRGLLCNNCNSGIGKLGDTIEAVEKALVYLQKDRTNWRTINDT